MKRYSWFSVLFTMVLQLIVDAYLGDFRFRVPPDLLQSTLVINGRANGFI